MVSQENIVILAGALGAVGSLFLFGVVGIFVDTPGQWGYVIAFLLLVGFGFGLPQLSLNEKQREFPAPQWAGVKRVRSAAHSIR